MKHERLNPKSLYIIAGCNGAGKTTASMTILPEILTCKEFVNADEIARGISPFNPSAVAVSAGKVMMKRIDELLEHDETFAIETTLASKVFTKTIKIAQSKGYTVALLFFWLQSVELAKKRVEARVKSGGHNVKADVIERRYRSGIKNLFELYAPIVDVLNIYNNTEELELIAQKKSKTAELFIIDKSKYGQIGCHYAKIR